MKNRAKRMAALLISVMTFSSLSSCASKVEQADESGLKRPGWMEEEDPQSASDSSEKIRDSETVQTTVVTTTVTTTTTTTTTTTPVLKGNLYDCKGELLMYSGQREDGSEERFTNDNNKVAFANILNKLSSGFDLVFEETLREKNPDPVNSNENVGRSIQLTLDANVQNAVYQYMANMNIVGSVVVMRNDGSILSEVSYPSYDPDIYEQDKDYGDTLSWGAFCNKAFQNATPGSCFKIMSEVLADKHGIRSLYDDGTWVDDGATIVNWDHDTNWSYPIADRSLYSAFVNSSNIFFAKAFDQIGKDAVLSDLGNIFNFGPGYEIYCDFGSLENNIEIYCNDDLRRSAFGQSYVRTCPIYLAALAREAVFGDMVKPFVVKNVVDTNNFNSVVESGSKGGEVIGSIPQECRQGILDGMSGVAGNLGLYMPEGYQFFAKTGTAETGAGDFLYITGCLKNYNDNGQNGASDSSYSDYRANGGSYMIVMQIQNPQDHNFSFASESAQLYKGVVDAVFSCQ